jgi:hypothetical protein
VPRHSDLPFAPLPGRGATEEEFFAAIVYHIFTTLRVCIPATVMAWNPSVPGLLPATVDIELDFLRARAIDNDAETQTAKGETTSNETAGKKAVGPWPRFVRIPIVYAGPPSFGIRGPIDVGTTGLYIVADRCLDQWLNTGGPLDPAVAVKHDINDGFFLASAYHGANSPTIPTDVHRLGPDDGSAGFEIAITDQALRVFTAGPTATIDALTTIKFGTSATLGVARQTDTVGPNAAMTAFMSQIAAAFTVINGIIPISIPVPPVGAIGTITSSSTKVKSE